MDVIVGSSGVLVSPMGLGDFVVVGVLNVVWC